MFTFWFPWMRDAKCVNDVDLQMFMREHPEKDFFHDKQTQSLAKEYCLGCPVFWECRALANQNILVTQNILHERYSGVMGGQTIRERRKNHRNAGKVLRELQERWTEQLQVRTSPIEDSDHDPELPEAQSF